MKHYACMICAGALALAASASAGIIWSGEQYLSGDQYIDLNFDSRFDVLITYGIYGNNSLPPTSYHGYLYGIVDYPGIDGSNRILVDAIDNYSAALPFGTLVSASPNPSLHWKGGMFADGLLSEWNTEGPEPDTQWNGLLGEEGRVYVGIAFDVGEDTHYGWVKIELGEEGPHGFATPVTTGWAYESTPGTPIAAGAIPEPSTGILTVGGSLALLFFARARGRGKQGRAPLPKCHASTEPWARDEW